MKIKTIFSICAILILIQATPLLLSLFSPEFKLMLISDAFGEKPSDDAIIMFESFALVVGLLVIGIIFFIIGSLSFSDQEQFRLSIDISDGIEQKKLKFQHKFYAE